jgi:hypothetical protein
MPGPTFVCEFVDGVVTRMTTHCPDGLDPERGIRLSRAAYESRRRRPPPEILKGHFENDDGVVKTYDAAVITAIDALGLHFRHLREEGLGSAEFGILNIVMPNDKPMRECTGTYVAEHCGQWEAGRKAGDKLMGEYWTDESIHELLAATD